MCLTLSQTGSQTSNYQLLIFWITVPKISRTLLVCIRSGGILTGARERKLILAHGGGDSRDFTTECTTKLAVPLAPTALLRACGALGLLTKLVAGLATIPVRTLLSQLLWLPSLCLV